MVEVDIKARLFSAYQEYLRNFYPKDPNIYVIRAHPETISDLKVKSLEYITNFEGWDWITDTSEVRFLGFRCKGDTRLPVGDIIFGPETIDMKWSK